VSDASGLCATWSPRGNGRDAHARVDRVYLARVWLPPQVVMFSKSTKPHSGGPVSANCSGVLPHAWNRRVDVYQDSVWIGSAAECHLMFASSIARSAGTSPRPNARTGRLRDHQMTATLTLLRLMGGTDGAGSARQQVLSRHRPAHRPRFWITATSSMQIRCPSARQPSVAGGDQF
jgi:hypothetical protein